MHARADEVAGTADVAVARFSASVAALARGDLASAEAHAVAAERAIGGDDPDAAACLLLRAQIDRLQGAYEAACGHAVAAEAILFAALRDDPDDTVLVERLAEAAAVHAGALIALGRYAEAEAALDEMLPRFEAVLAPASAALAAVYNARGVCARYREAWDEASAWYMRALAILVATHADPLAIAGVEHNLGGLELARGDAASGEPHAHRALTRRRAVLGESHPDVALELAAWAAVIAALGRTHDAEAALHRAHAILVATRGADCHEIAFILAALGTVAADAGRRVDAIAALEAARVLHHVYLDPSHPELARIDRALSRVR